MINLTKVIAAILVLLALALGGYAWVLGRQPPPASPAKTAGQAKAPNASPLFPVVVAARAVPAGQPIGADALRVAQLPIHPAGAFRETSAVVGRVPVFDLGEGTPLLEAQLVSGLALRVADGERAVAVKADEVMGVGNKVRPGDFVDVFVILKSDGKDVERSQARLLLARKRVLAFGAASVDGAAPANGSAAANDAARASAPRTAVLAVPVDEVNRLALAEAGGRLLLALRHPADLQAPDPALFAELPTALRPAPATTGQPRPPLQGLDRAEAGLAMADLASGGVQAPRAAAAALRPVAARPASPALRARKGGTEVEVIRGDKRETLQY